MNKYFNWKCLLLFPILLIVLSGCGNKEPQTPTRPNSRSDSIGFELPDNDNELSVATINIAIRSHEREIFTPLIERFEHQYQNIKVNVTEYNSFRYLETLSSDLSNDSSIDIFSIRDILEYSEFVEKELALSLNDFIRQSQFNVSNFSHLFEEVKINDTSYALPYKKDVWMLFYNKSLFDLANVEHPKPNMTWSEFRDLAKKMTFTKNTGQKVWGAYMDTSPENWYVYGIQAGGRLNNPDLSIFSSALQNRLNLEDDGSILRFSEQVRLKTHYNTLFQSGNLAMHINGSWHMDQLKEAETNGLISFEWDIAPIPYVEQTSPNTTIANASFLAINPNSEYPPHAWEFIKFISGEQGALELARNKIVPAYSSQNVKNVLIGEIPEPPYNIGLIVTQNVHAIHPPNPRMRYFIDTILYEESAKAFNRTKTPEDVITLIQDRNNQ